MGVEFCTKSMVFTPQKNNGMTVILSDLLKKANDNVIVEMSVTVSKTCQSKYLTGITRSTTFGQWVHVLGREMAIPWSNAFWPGLTPKPQYKKVKYILL